MINVVIGLVYNTDNALLISLRPMKAFLGGFWEFPGGKIEAGETAYQALQRELSEEIGITVNYAQHIMSYHHRYNEKTIKFSVWKIIDFHGKVYGKEQQEIQWATLKQLSDYTLPDGSQKIIDELLQGSKNR